MKNIRHTIVFALCWLSLAMYGADVQLADTLQFRFLLHGQTRRMAMVAESAADSSVLLRWTIGSGHRVYSGAYAMTAQSVERGHSLCFRQPEMGRTITVPDSETSFVLSRQAFADMRNTGRLFYNGVQFGVVDTMACGPEVGSFHVRDSVEGCEMWIVNDTRLPLIWKMCGNPLEIDWTVDNVAKAMNAKRKLLRMAFISDPHVMDVKDSPSHVRPLSAELRSTRLFNENEYAFAAALDDAVQRGIRLVVLPGDLTDDGQPSCQQAVSRMLRDYSRRYGMSFFLTTGNHDPARPWLADSVATGFYPCEKYLYWATPFSTYNPRNYSLAKALEASAVERRTYMMADGVTACDASYVVEPVEGLWLLSIDGGTFLPTPDGQHSCYGNASPGYDQALRHKPFLLTWIRRVVAEAKLYGKRVVAFCHYPVTDFTCGMVQTVRGEWGEKSLQADRVPSDSVAWALADSGIELHFAGHMHLNRATDIVSPNGNRMHCEQVPSTAMYMPGYKILTLDSDGHSVETVGIDSIGGMEELLPMYMDEYRKAKYSGEQLAWSLNDLYSMADYNMFCDMHLRHLVDLRLAKRDLPDSLLAGLMRCDGRQLAHVCGVDNPEGQWNWTGKDLLYDFYRLFYGGRSALEQIPSGRLRQYSALFRGLDSIPAKSVFARQLAVFGRVFERLLP